MHYSRPGVSFQNLYFSKKNPDWESNTAFKISNSIRAQSLQNHLFKLQVEEPEDGGPPELLVHTDISWLGRAKFLQQFRDRILPFWFLPLILGNVNRGKFFLAKINLIEKLKNYVRPLLYSFRGKFSLRHCSTVPIFCYILRQAVKTVTNNWHIPWDESITRILPTEIHFLRRSYEGRLA